MSEIIDTLFPINGQPTFLVNNAAVAGYVPVSYPSLVSNILYNGDGASIFAQGDNFIVLTVGLVMPLSFQIERQLHAGVTPYVLFTMPVFGITTGEQYYLGEWGAAAPFYIMENYDTPINIFFDVTKVHPVNGHNLKDEPFNLYLSLAINTGLNISMAGVPSSLNGTVQTLTPYLKILHNLPLLISP